MRILITVDPEIPVPPGTYGGIERVADLLVRELGRTGHVVGLVAHRDSTCPAHERHGWVGSRSRGLGNSAANALQLARICARFRPDVVHSFSRLLYLAPLMAGTIPKVMSYQREPTQRTVRWAHRLSGDSLGFTGCSEYICRQGRRAGGQWEAIHNPVDIDRLAFSGEVAPDAPLVFLSRIERVKGAHIAIEIARRTGRRLLVAGNHADSGAEGDYWRSEIEPQLGRGGIEYVGPVADREKAELLRNAAALVVPVQWEEPFGIVFAEALACGTPVISTRRGALPEIVRQGIDGYLVESTDAGCEAVRRIARIDRRACRGRAEALFATPVITARYADLYRRRMRGRPPRDASERTSS